MHGQDLLQNPSLTVALALAAGILAQSLAQHLRIPGIVLLLAVGVLLGPDVSNVIRPDTLGGALPMLVGFAVAIILFEGGLNLNLRRLLKENRPIRQLITIGAVVTVLGGTLAARIFLGWEWRSAILFGTLVIVTGPTVITPLLKRIKVQRSVATVLEAEGVLIDAIGAVVAAVALEVAISPSTENVAEAVLNIGGRIGVGVGIGAVGGLLIGLPLKSRRAVPAGLENVFALSMVLALFQFSNALMHESGIAAVTVAGIVVGNMETYAGKHLVEFKEQLTVMFIGMLFVLLAADVRIDEVRALGAAGIYTVAALMFIVRPANIFIGTWGTDLDLKQKLFMSWIGPRGIVAAAIASLFATSLEANGIPGGSELRALVFLVIAVTVLTAGLTGGLVAQILNLRRKSDAGWVIIGGHELARTIAHLLRSGGEDIVLVDSDPKLARAAEQESLRVIYGNALKTITLKRAGIDSRKGVIEMTANEDANLLFVQKLRSEFRSIQRHIVAIGQEDEGVTSDMIERLGGELLPVRTHDIPTWSAKIRKKTTSLYCYQLEEPGQTEPASEISAAKSSQSPYLALVVRRGGVTMPLSRSFKPKKGDLVTVLVLEDRLAEVDEKFTGLGWKRAESPLQPALRSGSELGHSSDLPRARPREGSEVRKG